MVRSPRSAPRRRPPSPRMVLGRVVGPVWGATHAAGLDGAKLSSSNVQTAARVVGDRPARRRAGRPRAHRARLARARPHGRRNGRAQGRRRRHRRRRRARGRARDPRPRRRRGVGHAQARGARRPQAAHHRSRYLWYAPAHEVGHLVAVDAVGAGVGEDVVVCLGDPARRVARHDACRSKRRCAAIVDASSWRRPPSRGRRAGARRSSCARHAPRARARASVIRGRVLGEVWATRKARGLDGPAPAAGRRRRRRPRRWWRSTRWTRAAGEDVHGLGRLGRAQRARARAPTTATCCATRPSPASSTERSEPRCSSAR